MRKPNRLRGKDLDEALERLLAEMISLGYERAPISRTVIQRKLGFTSRATFVGKRGSMIDEAKAQQLRDRGIDPSAKRRRASLDDRIRKLEAENKRLIVAQHRLYEALSIIVLACQAKGVNTEDVMDILRPSDNR